MAGLGSCGSAGSGDGGDGVPGLAHLLDHRVQPLQESRAWEGAGLKGEWGSGP